MKTDDVFHGITTLVYSSLPAGRAQGTGFFYQQLGPEDPEKAGQPQWRSIENTWVVTNRHVLLPEVDGVETVPDSFTWHLRRMDAEKICWEPIVINSTELRKRALFHPNPAVDVGVVSVLDLITDRIRGDDKYLQWYAVHGDQHPGKNKITVEVGDEALVIGYPREYYDRVNLFPIVKSGVVASRWGDNFDGEPFFLVDARLFPGSSGSIVVTRPQNFVIEDGTLLLNKEKQFAFLEYILVNRSLRKSP